MNPVRLWAYVLGLTSLALLAVVAAVMLIGGLDGLRPATADYNNVQTCIVEYQNGGYITSFGQCPRMDDQRFDKELYTVQRI